MAQPQEPDPIRQAFLHAFPNPNRIGCPGESVLRALARQELSIDHSAREHLSECSPCFKEFSEYQAEWKRKRDYARLALAVACVFLFASATIWWLWKEHFVPPPVVAHRKVTSQPSPAQKKPKPPTALLIPLDFRSLARERGVNPAQPEEIWSIPARLVILRITLPDGSAPGHYQVEIHSSRSRQTLQKISGTSRIANGHTILTTAASDLSIIPPGLYTLLFRHMGAAQHEVPIRIDPNPQ